jgi:antitoxin ParD1/3/4
MPGSHPSRETLQPVVYLATLCYDTIMASRVTVNVSLTPSLRRLVDGKVASGRYQSASEVFREALRLLEQHDRLRQRQLKKTREQIEVGLDEARRGELLDGEQVFEELVRPARNRRKRA